MPGFSSPLDVGTRLTSGFGQRWGTLHAGSDYGPPTPGERRRPVRAVADGEVIGVGRGNGKADAWPTPYHSGLTVLQDLGWIGSDRMRAHYGHLDEYLVKPGEYVVAGQIIGYMGGSGPNDDDDFAIHLHFGISQNHARPVRAARFLGDPGWINSHEWLRGKGITVGWTAPQTPELDVPVVPVATKPKPTTGIPEVGQSGGKNVRSDAALRSILIRAGHHDGNSGTSVGLMVERYQHRQFEPYQLPWDRVWGKRTEAHYLWTHKLQSALNRWKGDKILVDGDYRGATVGRVRDWQERNKYGVYKGYKIDGVAGPTTCRLLGVKAHP